MALTVPVPLALGRFKQLPQRSTEVWQGGLVRMPMWIDNPDRPDERPYRPVGAVWISLGAGLIHFDLPKDGTPASPALALSALLEFGLKNGRSALGRPARIEVNDPGLRDVLTDALSSLNTSVVVVPELQAVRQALAMFEEQSTGGPRIPGIMESPGVTADDVRAFADAAATFFNARPWLHLANEDLLVVESAKAPASLRHVTVLGRGGQEFGLAFHRSRADFEDLLDPETVNRRPPTHAFGVTFGPEEELPFADADAWEDLGLPVASPRAYPLAVDMFTDGRGKRPTRAELHQIEAVLRALADTGEDELDSGRWTKAVTTAAGPRSLTLTLPLLIEAESRAGSPHRRGARGAGAEPALARIAAFMSGKEFDSTAAANEALNHALRTGEFDPSRRSTDVTPIARAQELAWNARDAVGRLRIKLAKHALTLSRDCADAWLVLGESASTPQDALKLFEQAVAAGERAIGAEAFADLAGEFWGHLETRPYMRARLALAETLIGLERTDEALGHFREMLRLNPNDNQGVRYLLVPLLLQSGHDRDAREWLDRYPDDAGATMVYAEALLTFRTEGDNPAARRAAARAISVNKHVVDHLLGLVDAPIIPYDHYALGSREEAASVATDLIPAFERTDGVLDWIARQAQSVRRGRRPGGPRAAGGRGKKSGARR